ncbi:MAG: hypothetical protein M1819_006233 [Sarea resinae]|nr:MAG: hypothetical protein M1819_006233 [Sarea resinae]
MVVQVKERRPSTAVHSSSAESPASTSSEQSGRVGLGFGQASTPSQSGAETHVSVDIPFYDPNNPMPNNPLITHLGEVFFAHLGCNFPFLQRDRFLRDLAAKRVDAILVDAVCGLAARFSTHPLLTSIQLSYSTGGRNKERQISKSQYGQAFAQRAMSAVVDAFSCPSVAVVQACLLLAYEEFGSNHDSGLWMFLGISIRMAQDLGMQKLEGLQFEGRDGPTPKSVKNGYVEEPSEYGEDRGSANKSSDSEEHLNERGFLAQAVPEAVPPFRQNTRKEPPTGAGDDDPTNVQHFEEQRAVERERIDTFWAIFFLDRVISSGTGRPVTLRDKDVELSFPREEVDPVTGWPAPFPALIRIIHLYGRVTDLLNNFKEINHVTSETVNQLAGMEHDLTSIYQRLSPKLHFNAVNFQHYVKAGQGINFILLHFWFHTLIVLLHQPTLLHSFEGRMQQLFPNSRELSVSSAKTIADILAFAELIDANSFIGNPFTCQPIYTAACAFLMESAAHTDPLPEVTTPLVSHFTLSHPPSNAPHVLGERHGSWRDTSTTSGGRGSGNNAEQKKTSKHSLLAAAANQNYQCCYKALKSIETYWAGAKYILTVLDQKAKGIGDPLLYTIEEAESALEVPKTRPAFTSSGWRRRLSHSEHAVEDGSDISRQSPLKFARPRVSEDQRQDIRGSPSMDPSHAIGWSLTGTTNSPNSNLSFLYQTSTGELAGPAPMSSSMANFRPSLQSTLEIPSGPNTATSATSPLAPSQSSISRMSVSQMSSDLDVGQHSPNTPLNRITAPLSMAKHNISGDPVATSDAEMLLGLHSPYPASAISQSRLNGGAAVSYDMSGSGGAFQQQEQPQQSASHEAAVYDFSQTPRFNYFGDETLNMPLGDMMIESQDIDMSSLGGDNMMPWYLPQDMLGVFEASSVDGGGMPLPHPPSQG